jgi:structural maintenance of chromosome 2
MDDFKNNKDSKLKEIKVSWVTRHCAGKADLQTDIANKKKELGKQTTQVKTRQKEIQTIELELRKLSDSKLSETSWHRQNRWSVIWRLLRSKSQRRSRLPTKPRLSLPLLRRRWRSSRYADDPWRSIVADKKNDYKAAEDKLNKERATLVAFDNELNDLDKDLKIKKKEIVDSELGLKKAEHDTSLIAKERSSLEVMKENLEKQFTWILEEKQ